VSSDPVPPTDAVTDPTVGERVEQISGPLVAVSGFGLVAADPASGRGRALKFSAVEGVDIRSRPVVAEGVAYVLTYDTVPGQSYSQTVYLSALDLATGSDRRVATLGATRETDTSPTLTEYDSLTVASGLVWVRRGTFGSRERELVAYDLATGAERRVVPVDMADHLVTDGARLYFYADGLLKVMDAATGTVKDLLSQFPYLAALIASPSLGPLGDLVTTRSGNALSTEDAGRLGDLLSVGLGAMAWGDGSLWVLASGSAGTVSGDLALAELVLRIDPVTGKVTSIAPTTGIGEYFTGPEEISLGDEAIAYADGSVWVVDRQSNGALLRLDPSAESVSVAYEPCAADLRCDNGVFNLTDPDGLWMQLTRFGPKSADGTSSGPISIEQIDTASGTLVRSIPVADLLTG